MRTQTQFELPGEQVTAEALQPGDVLYGRDGWSQIGIVAAVIWSGFNPRKPYVTISLAAYNAPTCADGCCGGTECGVSGIREFKVEGNRAVRRVSSSVATRQNMLRWLKLEVGR